MTRFVTTKTYRPMFLLFLAFIFNVSTSSAQNLSAGDIAFIGFHLDDPDGFTFITLKDIPAGEVIYFTDHSWSYSFNTWHNNTNDAHYSWTAPVGGVNIGTIITVTESTTTPNLLNVTMGSMNQETTGDFSLISAGDAIFAYQSTTGAQPSAANATFIAGIYTDDKIGRARVGKECVPRRGVGGGGGGGG